MERTRDLRVLGKYRILAEIGYGGMAEVFLGVMEGPAQFSKLIALKVLRPHFAVDPDGLAMFLNEARLAARLNHPNVVQTYEVGEAGERHYIAMEYLDGQPFSRVLKLGREGRPERGMPLPMSLRVIAESLAGLHYAHELKDFDGVPLQLVHRDVSPQNVLITYDGTIKMLDFGIAKAVGGSSMTRTGVLKGKVGYMAPEQVLDDGIDRRADVYAVGIMLWEVIANRRLWSGGNEVAILTKVANEAVPNIKEIAPDTPDELARICMKAVARKREDRFESAAEFQQALEDFLDASSERALPRSVGKFVSTKFEQVRLNTRKIIDEQLARSKELPSTPSGALMPVSLPTASGTMPALLNRPSEMSGPAPVLSTLVSREISGSSLSGPKQAPSRSGKLATIALLGVLVAVAVWALAFKRPRDAASAASSASSTSAASAASAQAAATTEHADPAAAPAVADVDLLVNAEPREAKLFVDDEQLGSNPCVKKIPRDGSKHVIRAEAPGYLPDAQVVVADVTKTINFQLKSSKQAAAAPVYRGGGRRPGSAGSKSESQPAAQPAAAPPQPAPAADPKAPRDRKIDPENPYEGK